MYLHGLRSQQPIEKDPGKPTADCTKFGVLDTAFSGLLAAHFEVASDALRLSRMPPRECVDSPQKSDGAGYCRLRFPATRAPHMEVTWEPILWRNGSGQSQPMASP